MRQEARMMKPMRNLEPNILVELRSGKYPLVDSDGLNYLNVPRGKKGLLLETVGRSPKNSRAWHVLVEGNVVLVWDEHIGVPSK